MGDPKDKKAPKDPPEDPWADLAQYERRTPEPAETKEDPWADLAQYERRTPLQAGLPLPEDVKAAANEAAQGASDLDLSVANALDKAHEKGVTALQGASRYLGGDVIREGLNRVETKIQDALDVSPETRAKYDLFQSRDQVQANRERNPTAATVGEAAGLVGSAFVPVGRAAGLLPATGINAAGAAARTAVAAKVAGSSTSALRGLLAKGAGLAAQGATEGALLGATREVNDAFLRGDYRGLAEKLPTVLEEGATGAALSVGTAGAVGALKLGLKGIKAAAGGVKRVGDVVGAGAERKAIQGAQTAERELADALADEADLASANRMAQAADDEALSAALAAKTADEAASAVEQRASELARKPHNAPSGLVEMAEGARLHRSAVVDGTKSIRAKQNELLQISAAFDEHADRIAKQRLNKELNGWGSKVASPETSEIVSSISGQARAMLSDGGAAIYAPSGGSAALKHIANISDAFLGRVTKKLEAGEIGDAYNQLDNLKLVLGRMQRSRDGAVKEFAENSYESIRLHLENAELWGPLAERQKLFNAVVSKQISAEDADAIQSLFATSGQKNTWNPWENFTETNDGAVRSLLGEIGSGLEQREDAYRYWLATLDTSLSTRAGVMQNPELLKQAARARELVRGIANELDSVGRLRQGADAFAEAKAAAELTPTIHVAGFSADGKGALKLADMVAAARIAERGAAAKAGAATRELASQRAMRRAAEAQRRVNDAAENGKLWRQAAELSRGLGAVGGGVSRGAGYTARKVGERTEDIRRTTVRIQSVIEAADRLAEPDSEESSDLQSSLMRLEREAGTEFAQAYGEQLQRRADFLRSKAGPAPAPTLFGGEPKRVLDDETAARMARYVAAADDPSTALVRIADGDGTAEDIETMRELYPSTWAEFSRKAVAGIAERRTELPYDQQLAISGVLGLPLTPDADPSARAVWAALAMPTAEAEAAKPIGGKFNAGAEGFTGKADRIG